MHKTLFTLEELLQALFASKSLPDDLRPYVEKAIFLVENEKKKKPLISFQFDRTIVFTSTDVIKELVLHILFYLMTH